ncbi:thioredoxin, mitochondrial-like isoform X2 [Conger conger]|nr:thioredoxin, mitochondrial-like isoform X2 [Conger conger]
MAYRLVVRRIWNLPVKDLRSPHLCAPSPALLSRSLSVAPRRSVSFSVQDHDDFTDRVINSNLPVLVDFHAQWCGPCKILGPRLEKAVAKQQGRVAMAKVDIDDHTDLAIEYGVSAVPTVIAMRGGDVIDQFVGIKDEEQLDSFVGKLIGQ